MDDQRIVERDVNTHTTKVTARDVDVFYGNGHAEQAVKVAIPDKMVTADIAPSGRGKPRFLRCLNRMNDTIVICRVTGGTMPDGENICDPRVDSVQLRAKKGMVSQKPTSFPKPICDNVASGPKIHGLTRYKAELDGLVEASLHSKFSVVVATHSMQQTARISQRRAFFHLGPLRNLAKRARFSQRCKTRALKAISLAVSAKAGLPRAETGCGRPEHTIPYSSSERE